MTMQQGMRQLGLSTLVVLAAVLVVGVATAQAATREEAVQQANDAIDRCYRNGGDPEVIEVNNDIVVKCDFHNADDYVCVWSPEPPLNWGGSCAVHFAPVPGGELPDLHPIDPSDLQPVTQNAAPLARPDRYRVTEDRVLRRGPAQGVLANDADPDGDRLAVRLVAGPSKGRLGLKPDGSFTYRPKRNVHGTDRFTYEVRDGEGGTATATVTIKVTARPR